MLYDVYSIRKNHKKLPLGTTIIMIFLIFYFWYLIRIGKFDIFVIFTNFWQTRKRSKFDTKHWKRSIPYTPRSPLQNLLMPFYDRTTLISGLSERDDFILDLCDIGTISDKARARDFLLQKVTREMAPQWNLFLQK